MNDQNRGRAIGAILLRTAWIPILAAVIAAADGAPLAVLMFVGWLIWASRKSAKLLE